MTPVVVHLFTGGDVLFNVFCQVGETHVSFADECVVHGECGREFVLCLSAAFFCVSHVVLQHGSVIGVCHFDEFGCLLHVALVTEVCYAVFGDNCVDVVVCMVDVADEGYDAGDGSALCC